MSVGDCCEVMKLVLERRPASGTGFDIYTSFTFSAGAGGDVLAYNFRKAKKGDDGQYGYGKPYAKSTYAQVSFCPFCGTPDAKKAGPSDRVRG